MKKLLEISDFLDKPDANAEAFFLCKEGDTRLSVYRTVIDGDTLRELRVMQLRTIRKELKETTTDDVIPYNPAMTPDRKVVFTFDEKNIEEVENFHAVAKDATTLPPFSFTNSHSSIRALVIRYTDKNGGTLFTVRKMDKRRVLKEGGRLALVFRASTFSKFEDNLITLDEGVDGILYDGTAYIFNCKGFEYALLFSKYIIDTAEEAVAEIEKLNFLVSGGYLEELVGDHHHQRKLCNITQIGLPSTISLKKIEDIAKKINKTLNISAGKIVLASKAEAKTFVKILHDDYLMSELTGTRYDAHSKQKIS